MSLDQRVKTLMRRKKKRESAWYRKWWLVLVLFILLVIIIYLLSLFFLARHMSRNPDSLKFFMLNNNLLKDNPDSIEKSPNFTLVEGHNNYYLGSADPVLTLVVFSDFNCSYCQKASSIIASLAVKYGDKIKIIVRDYPVIGEDSMELAQLARCAGEQGKYWPIYHILFEKQGKIEPSDFNYLVNKFNLNYDQMADCLEGQKYRNDVLKDATDGQFLGISGTPAWFINGELAGEGLIPFEVWDNFFANYL